MHARKIAVPLFALACALTFSAFAGAAADAPAAETPQAVEKACCKHHEGAGDKSGMHCDHAKMKGEGEKGEACCARHAAMHQEGASADGKACCAKHAEMMKGDASADGKAGCARHAEMMKGDAAADGKACCAQHAKMMQDGAKGCCCAGEANPHPAAEEAPAKS